ncbi:hypothetical protein LCGC14_2499230 [marine sediment metagenome]|uniref:Uncharacterized protein n=1 Tax=marine sediment metagenome TaxID=412755 RepID=A0A0F9B332_9ZZZZ
MELGKDSVFLTENLFSFTLYNNKKLFTYLVSIMKTINVTFTDKEIEQLTKKKGVLSWHDFIIELAEKTEGFIRKVEEKPKGAKK